MSTVENTSQPGRPPIKVNLSQAEQLCHIGCTLREVAGFFKCSEDTVQRVIKEERGQTFSEFYAMHSADGDISLRKAQYQKATSGDVKMLIWLGKQRLGQTDKQEVNHSGAIAGVRVTIEEGKERNRG